jgi:OmpA-OmpF porin, OOP family
MRLRSALLAATILAAPVTVLAQPIDGLYVGAGAGVNYLEDQKIKDIVAPTGVIATNTKARSEIGFVTLGSVGWGLGNGLRFELEGNYRQNKERKIYDTRIPTAAGGNSETFGGMVNALYDFDLSPFGIDFVQPYVGAGVGYAWQDLHGVRFNSYPNPATYRGFVRGTEGDFAAQGIAGFAIPVPPIPGLAITAEYRAFAKIGSDKYNGTLETPLAPAGAPIRVKVGDEVNHSGLIGLRYAFFTPVPPPPPVVTPPPVPPTRSYLVFFDWDKATLTARARQIIREAADASTHVQYTRIEVSGYTDTSGTPQYNQGLSVRRAEAVAAELVRDGVPRNVITIQGFGETHLLVPTGPGVREPQNRRVEIIIQ